MQTKHLLVLLLMIITPYFCYGDGYDDTYNKLKQDSTFSPLIKYEEFIEHSLPVIEARMMQVDSELVKSSKNDTKEQKIVKYNNRLAQKVFDDYKNYFFEDIKKKSKETGRKIQPYGEIKPDTQNIWLDRGILETEKCQSLAYKPKNNSREETEKALKYEREHTCLFPDGFEDFFIVSKPTHLFVFKDDKQRNVTFTYDVYLKRANEPIRQDNILSSIFLGFFKKAYDYHKTHEVRNKDKQNVIDGIVEIDPDNEDLVRYNYEKFEPLEWPEAESEAMMRSDYFKYNNHDSGLE